MVSSNQIENTGLIERMKEVAEPEAIAQKFGIDKNLLIDIGVYGGIGFIVGFFLKKYSEYFISLALLVVGLVVLQQFDYVSLSVNVVKVQEALGLMQMPLDSNAFGAFILEWMKMNVAASSSLVVGFLIGLKVG